MSYRGVLAPILTPFNETGAPDAGRYTAFAEQLLEEGCTGLVPFGTTGEANSLALKERQALLEALVDAGIGPEKLLPGVGLCALPETVELTGHALGLGCGGVLLLPPFYYKGVSEEGIYRAVAQTIEAIADDRLNVYLYHIPPVAQVEYSVDLVKRLKRAFPATIAGIKDSSGDWQNTKALIETVPDLEVFAGSERFLLDTLQTGGAGCITASANINATAIRAVFDEWRSPRAPTLQQRISDVRLALQDHPPLIPLLKAIVAHQTKDPLWRAVRPPFVPFDAGETAQIVPDLVETLEEKLE